MNLVEKIKSMLGMSSASQAPMQQGSTPQQNTSNPGNPNQQM